ncbi:MAG: oligosaccharide flippase family protein [Dehalococcoidia bacterium]
MQPASEATTRKSFLESVNVVVVTYAVDGLLAFATAALVARALGDEGRGAYGIFILSTALGQLVLGLGIGNAAIYYLNRREVALRDVVSAVHLATLGSLAVSALAVAVVAPWAAGRAFGDGIAPWLFILAVPALLYLNLLRLVLQALSRFVDLGITTIGQQALLLAAVAVAFAVGDPSPEEIVGYFIAASVAAGLFALFRIGVSNIDVTQIVRPRWDVLRRLIHFGAQGEAGNVLQALNYRFDQYLVRGFAGLAAVGVYAVGASMTEALFVLANAVALVLMPRLTSADADDVAWMTPVACRNMLLVAAGGAVGLAVVAPVLVPGVFGDEFERSVDALWWLLPGTVALCGSKVLTSYIFSRGRPLVNTGITAVSLVVTLVADFALIPVFGVNGAAAASSLAYGAHFAAALYAYGRISGQPVLEAVIPRPADGRLYGDALRGALARISRGRAEAGRS